MAPCVQSRLAFSAGVPPRSQTVPSQWLQKLQQRALLFFPSAADVLKVMLHKCHLPEFTYIFKKLSEKKKKSQIVGIGVSS